MLVAGRRVKLAAAAVGAVTVLAGCGVHPGAAAVVGDDKVSRDEVDDFALAACAANVASAQGGGPAQSLPTRGAREWAVGFLIQAEVTRQFGEDQDVEPNHSQVSRGVAQEMAGLPDLREEQTERLREAVRSFYEGQSIVIEAGRKALGPGAEDQEAAARGSELLMAYADKLEIEVDPRFGRFEDGVFKRGGTSLSVPASDRAVAGDRDQPDPAFIAELPASQLCR